MNENIINDYLNHNLSIESLSSKYKLGKLKVKKILLDNNVEIRKKGGQIKHIPIDFNYSLLGKNVSCKKCKKIFNDIENKSGSITQHINKCFPDVVIPNKLYRSNYKKTNGEYWHLKYFNIIDKLTKETLNCPICEWSTNDLNNKTGSLTKHINKEHNSVDDFLKKHKEFGHLFNPFLKESTKNNYFDENEDNYITCQICNKKFKTITNTHLETHNTNINEYLLNFNKSDLISNTHKKIYTETLLNVDSNKITYRSVGETEICDFLTQNGIEVEICNKKILNGTELDIFLPKHKIAIEFNGLYWHSEKQGKTKNYHLDKTKKCSEKNIRLIHIFSDEWENKKQIIKNRLEHILKVNTEKIYARKCEIIELTKKEKTIFLNETHLQGNDKSKIWIGLKHKNQIVSVITFGELRKFMGGQKKDGHYEIYRFASKNVIGGFSKLLKFFINKYRPKNIITYADRNWTPSDEFSFYSNVGFKFISETKPNYYYTKNYKKREHRYNFSKSKLINMGYDHKKSETQIMFENGFDRVWDCGNLKYKYNFI